MTTEAFCEKRETNNRSNISISRNTKVKKCILAVFQHEKLRPCAKKERQMIEVTPPFFPRPRPAITGDGERTRTLIGATIAQTCLAVAHIIHLNTNLVMDG